jgi:hypothetical protein
MESNLCLHDHGGLAQLMLPLLMLDAFAGSVSQQYLWLL